MRITADEVRELVELIRQDPALQEQIAEALLEEGLLERILLAKPERRVLLRRLLLGEEFETLPEIVRELVHISQQSLERLTRLETTVAELVEVVRQSVARLDRHEAELAELRRTVAELTETVRQSVARLDRHEAELAELRRTVAELTETVRQSVARLDRHEAELAELRRTVAELSEIVRQSVARLDRLEAVVAELVETSRRSTERLDRLEAVVAELVETSRQSVERLNKQEAIVAELVELSRQTIARLERLERKVDSLEDWRRGETGRREGELYERDIRRKALRLFAGGRGGSPELDHVQEQLRQWFARLPLEYPVTDENDPTLADIIWWKDSRVLVVEVSLKLDRYDVWRAKQRAETLRAAGVDATPLVVGKEWANPEYATFAEEQGVESLAEDRYSDGLIEFRRLPDPYLTA
ncbi:MAG: hypothetical protein RMK45_08115 [Armatimonadota bacterium]|nr:hypothetical protein [Armatimonadota bacterium]